MYDEHWSDDAIIEKLLLGDTRPEDGHLRSCRACARKWEEAQSRRRQRVTAEPEIPNSLLVRQQRAIQERLQRPAAHRRFVPALAAAVLTALVIVVLFRPASPPPSTEEDSSDSAIFDDVFKISSSTEPSSVRPVKSLFEVEQ